MQEASYQQSNLSNLCNNSFLWEIYTASNTAITKFLQSYGIILLPVDYEFNIYLTKGECIPYETTAFLNILKSNISTGVQSALASGRYLPFSSLYKLTR